MCVCVGDACTHVCGDHRLTTDVFLNCSSHLRFFVLFGFVLVLRFFAQLCVQTSYVHVSVSTHRSQKKKSDAPGASVAGDYDMSARSRTSHVWGRVHALSC